MKISELSSDERPMERLLIHGAETLSNAELLAILIRTGNKNENAIDLARKLLSLSGGSLTALSGMSLEAMCTINGLGKGKAMNIITALEVGKRFLEEGMSMEGQTLHSSSEVFKMMLPRMKGLSHEELWAIWLTGSKKVIGADRISSGGSAATIIDQKLILKKALEKNAAGFVIIHNHPSGNPMPSKADISETEALRDSCKSFGLSILDHVIITSTSYFSFADAAMSTQKQISEAEKKKAKI